ncbi:helix-turn-helix domain-containing protein [Teredinibacter haidensis]|uniref:helix-turn-helix domain-containing protein n=1 Tax=Teredinibacter haidensis TaxID=2731755 RepID=UPI00163BD499|nr:helix-turn-helix domain-containing protein [Teredinibacter haidensis]
MKNDARKLSTEEQHLIRKIAVQRVHDGESAAEVTRSFGLGSRTIFTWLRLASEKGIDALAPKARTGRNRTLSDLEEQEIKRS